MALIDHSSQRGRSIIQNNSGDVSLNSSYQSQKDIQELRERRKTKLQYHYAVNDSVISASQESLLLGNREGKMSGDYSVTNKNGLLESQESENDLNRSGQDSLLLALNKINSQASYQSSNLNS